MLKSIRFAHRISCWNRRSPSCQHVANGFLSIHLLLMMEQHHNQKRSIMGSSAVITGVFPDDTASAAGVRTRFLLERLGKLAQKQSSLTFNHQANTDGGGSVILTTTDKDWGDGENKASTSSTTTTASDQEQKLQEWIPNLKVEHLPMNRSQAVHQFLSRHEGIQRIIFDRFYVEEAFSHFVWENNAYSSSRQQDTMAMILDMQDMHSLRHGRQALVRRLDRHQANNGNSDDVDPLAVIPDVMDYLPTVNGGTGNKDTDRLLRELASIHRCDLTLVCSPYEMDLLSREYGVPPDKLCLASFFVDPSSIVTLNHRVEAHKGWNDDDNDDTETKIIFCGGFLHDPNVDAVHVLLQHIWPRLQQMVEPSKRQISLHIHGAYCPQTILQMHNPKNGVYIHGYTPRLEDIFDNSNGRRNILLAPLRFGAGIKGKILDAWVHGMPVVTTPIGSEGIVRLGNENNFGGAICSTLEDFCGHAIALLENLGGCYFEAQQNGWKLLRNEFHADRNWDTVQQHLQTLHHDDTLEDRRRRDPVQAMLWHQSLRSTKYMSKWIEEKETRTETNN